jgi:hypothetical protein
MPSQEQLAAEFGEMVDRIYAEHGIDNPNPNLGLAIGGVDYYKGSDHASWNNGELVRKAVPGEAAFGAEAKGLEFAVTDSRPVAIFRILNHLSCAELSQGPTGEATTSRELEVDESELLLDWLCNPHEDGARATLSRLRRLSADEKQQLAANIGTEAARNLTVSRDLSSEWRSDARRRNRRLTHKLRQH